MIEEKAVLALADGTIFRGKSIGASGRVNGEIVFNTSMTGYQEILTDPSYSKQIVTLTYPHIGNTGTNEEDIESGTRGAALGGVVGVLKCLILIPQQFLERQYNKSWL